MLSIKSLGSASSELAAYYASFAQDTYYQQGGEPPGCWHGKLARDLDLFGEIRGSQLSHMFAGRHPISGEDLAGNAGESHKAGWDLTFSAPKSVSIAWALADQETQASIALAHDKAVQRALDYVEDRAFSSRDRREPQSGRGRILAAVFQHGTSRALDPQLHSHAIVANLGRRIDGSWCALDFDSRWKMASGAIYRAELAKNLRELGYTIERDKSSFRIAGVSQSICDAFSKRRQQILEELSRLALSGAKAASVASLSTRSSKDEVDRTVLMPIWRSQAAELGMDLAAFNALTHSHALNLGSSPDSSQIDSCEFDRILVQLIESASVFSRMQLEAAVAVHAQGRIGADAVGLLINREIGNRARRNQPLDLVPLRRTASSSRRQHGMEFWTTREMLAIERDILDQAINRKASVRHYSSCLPGLAVIPLLSSEQVDALKHITEAPGTVSVVVGLPGTGKSTLLAAANAAWFASGFHPIGAALAGKAADGLETGSGIRSQTLHSLLLELDSRRRVLSDRDIVVLDEAAMVGSRQLQRLLAHVHAAQAKAVLVGDPGQLQSIEAGGVFKVLADQLGCATLADIRRQRQAEDIQVIHNIIDGQINLVLDELRRRNLLFTPIGQQLHLDTSAHWFKGLDVDSPGQSLMLAATRSDCYQLNLLARERLREIGKIHNEVSVETSRGSRQLGVGERVIFLRNDRRLGVKNGQTGSVTLHDLDRFGHRYLTVAIDGGAPLTVNPSDYPHLDYGYAMSIHKSQGITAENVTVLLSDVMSDRELSTVALSRHRDRVAVFIAKEQIDIVADMMANSHQKESVLNYLPIKIDCEVALELD